MGFLLSKSQKAHVEVSETVAEQVSPDTSLKTMVNTASRESEGFAKTISDMLGEMIDAQEGKESVEPKDDSHDPWDTLGGHGETEL